MPVIEVEQMYSREEAAGLLSCSVDKIDDLRAKGRRNGLWPTYHIDGMVRIPEKALLRLLKSRRIN